MSESSKKEVFHMKDLADPIPRYVSTHSAGTLHALCGAIMGLQQLEQQIEKTQYQKENGIVNKVQVPSDLPTVRVPVERVKDEEDREERKRQTK